MKTEMGFMWRIRTGDVLRMSHVWGAFEVAGVAHCAVEKEGIK